VNRLRIDLHIALMVAVLSCLATAGAVGQPPDVLYKVPDWRPADAGDVASQAMAWLKQNDADGPTTAKAAEIWANTPEQPTGAELLARLVDTFSLIDERAAGLVRLCERPKSRPSLPDQSWPDPSWLADEKTPPLLSNNMRLLYGRWLIHQQLYDEAAEQIADVEPGDVVAPALLLFCQSVAHHTLLEREAGLKAIGRLLDGERQSPRRYVVVARLMQQDLDGLQDDTLDHIARRMDDVRRRLDLGRAGEKVQNVERGVIESLDKLIEKLEKEQKKSQSSSSSSRGKTRPNKPAERSQIIDGKGRGEVTRRRIGTESGWGDLPPKQREDSLQQIGRDFPSHYRDVIEQYFRKLAAEGTD